MLNQQNHRFLITGIGNTLRGDDGVGAYICSSIDALNIEGVKTLVTQQLHIELLEEFVRFDHIILVDATINDDGVSFSPVKTDETSPVSSSHHADAGLLVSLAKQLYQKKLSAMICTVKGEKFDMGDQLSAAAKHNAGKAVDLILDWIKKSR